MTGDGAAAGYPRRCPECGAATAFRPPEGCLTALLISVGSAAALVVAPLPLLLVSRWEVFAGLVLAAVYLGTLVGYFLVLRATGGVRFAQDGFVLCPECRWMRVGDVEGRRLGALRTRGEGLFRAAFRGLLAVFAFFGCLAIFFGRPDAWVAAAALLFPTYVARLGALVYRPRRFPDGSERRR